MANANRKIQEGLGLIKEAEKHLKTGFFKWSADFDSAADKYQKAAVCFKVARAYDRAQDAFIKTAECHEKNGQLFHAGKALTEAVGISCEAKKFKEAMELMEKACQLYREYGSPDTACINLVSTAKKIEFAEPMEAMKLYEKAADIAEEDEKLREAVKHLNDVSRLLAKCKQYSEAVSIMKRQIDIYEKVENYGSLFNIVLCIVLVNLTEKDVIAAENMYHKGFDYPGFGNSDAAEAIEVILEAYKNGDKNALKTMTSKSIITCQDIEYARLGKMLEVPEGGECFDESKKDRGEIGENELVEKSAKIEINEDELEEGLC